MTVEELKDFFEANNNEYIRFEKIPKERLLCPRPDMHAFMLLDQIDPPDTDRNRDMISWAGHDEFSIDISVEKIAEKATEQQLIDLIRCGLRIADDGDYFLFFA